MGHGKAYELGIPGLDGGERIGEGGNAVVYRCHQPDLDRFVAVKVLKSATDDGTKRRFDRERKAMGRLSQHDGIVTVYDTGFLPTGEPYLTMPLLEASLEDEIARRQRLAWPDAVRTMATVCETVAYAHSQGVVHRDLKPGNIMRAQSGRPLVSDFGISRIVDAEISLKSTALTLTPAYSPPEALDGADAAPRADIYALGATLYALLEGHPPFMDPGGDLSLIALVRRIVEEPVGPFSDDVPEHVRAIVRTAMDKVPRDRYESAAAFGAALEQAIAPADDLERTMERPPPPGEVSADTVAAPPGPASALSGALSGAPSGENTRENSRRGLMIGTAAVLVVALVGALAFVIAGRDDSDLTESNQVSNTAVDPESAAVIDDEVIDDEVIDAVEPVVSDAPTTTVPTTTVPATTVPVTTVPVTTIPATTVAPTTAPATTSAPPPAVAGEPVGPAELGSSVSQLLIAGDEVWFTSPRAGETTGRLDIATFDELEGYEFDLFPIRIAVDADAVYGSSIDGALSRAARNGGPQEVLEFGEQARLLGVDDEWLWAVTADSTGSSTQLHRIDKTTLTIDQSVDLPDFAFHLAVGAEKIWVVFGGRTLVSIDAATLEVGPELVTDYTGIDDIEVVGDTVFVTGSIFDSALSGEELARASVSSYDAVTGALRFGTITAEPVSIFDDVHAAAGPGGVWVVNQTSRTATFVDAAGELGESITTLRNVTDAALVGDDLLVLAGPSSGGDLYRLPL
ncbi:MAG: serine/threonine-protein kinase [Ilumatobacter sp.]